MAKIARKLIRIDVVIALIIGALSATGFAGVYRRVTLAYERQGFVAEAISLGEAEYLIKQGGRCVGRLSRKLKIGRDTIDLLISGELNTKLAGVLLQNNFSLEANFNALGQMIGTILNLKNETLELKVGLLERNPTALKIRGKIQGSPFKYGSEIAQAPELKRGEAGHYRLRLPWKGNSGFTRELKARLLNELNFQVVQTQAQGEQCPEMEQGGGVDLDPLMEVVRSTAMETLGPLSKPIFERLSNG